MRARLRETGIEAQRLDERGKQDNDLEKTEFTGYGYSHQQAFSQINKVQREESPKQKKRRMIEQSKQGNGNEDRMAIDNDIKQK